MTLQVFLLGLLIVSTLTGLTVQALKVLLDERGAKYHSNALAGIVSVCLSLVIGIAYIVITGTVSAMLIVCLIALVFLSWLCAMVGYDKVIQAISQFKGVK